METRLKAYGLLSALNNKFQRKDIRPELYLLAGSLGEDFMKLGDRDSARKLLGASTVTLELICKDAMASAKTLVSKYEAQLVTKYYQLSFLCDDNVKELADAKEKLLDLCLHLAARLMETGADEEVCDRAVAALTDKSVLLSKGGNDVGAQELLRDAMDIGARLIQNSPQWHKYVSSFLRAAGVRGSLLLEASPRESCDIFSAALAEIDVKGPVVFDAEIVDRVAMTWMGKARAQRTLGDVGDVVRSYSRAAALWEEAIARKHYGSTQAYSQFACDHVNWLIDQRQIPLARQAVAAMIDTFRRVACETNSPNAHAAVAHFTESFRSILGAV
jgi:hypothetical protein